MLLGDPGVEEHLEQHVAQLLAQRPPVTLLDRLDQLVRLLDQVLHQALVRLLGVPGAAARRAEPVHHRHQVQQPRPRQVVRARQHLDLRHLTGPLHRQPRQRVRQPRIPVRAAQPHRRPGPGRLLGQQPRQRGRRPGRHHLHRHPGLPHRRHLRMPLVPHQHPPRRPQRLPRRPREQPGSHPVGGGQQDQLGTRHIRHHTPNLLSRPTPGPPTPTSPATPPPANPQPDSAPVSSPRPRRTDVRLSTRPSPAKGTDSRGTPPQLLG